MHCSKQILFYALMPNDVELKVSAAKHGRSLRWKQIERECGKMAFRQTLDDQIIARLVLRRQNEAIHKLENAEDEEQKKEEAKDKYFSYF